MRSHISTVGMLHSMVSVSRFNKGEAAKIFDEVAQDGIKIAMKNNKPACVLLSPEKYEALIEEMEELNLIIETEKRLNEGSHYISEQEFLKQIGVNEADIALAPDLDIE